LAYETLTCSRDDRVATITLDRPDRLNAISRGMPDEIRAAINSVFENMGMCITQTLATIFDGMTRHSPEGIWFKQRAEEAGFHQAVQERDSGEPIPGSKPPRNN
jgi:enoyl-CoA hydratase